MGLPQAWKSKQDPSVIGSTYSPKAPCLGTYPSYTALSITQYLDFAGGSVVKNSPTNAGDTGSLLGPARFHMSRGN